VKRILVLEHDSAHVLRGKTGFSDDRSGVTVGWFVGYVEKGDNVYFFACNMTSPDARRDGARIVRERKDAALRILSALGAR